MALPTTPGAVASSQTTLAGVERPNTGETPAFGRSPPELAKNDAYLSGGSTRAASVSGALDEKKDAGTGSSSIREEPLDSDGMEYPQGWTLGMVIVALVLSIFLVSLDMVCRALHLNPVTTVSNWLAI